jgi:hypothetical protein
MNWFDGCKTEAEIKARYRDLAKRHHPDLGGDVEIMKSVNAAYEAALKGEYRKVGMDESYVNWRWSMDAEAASKVTEVLRIKRDLKVELCGLWIWITGDTRPVKDQLKAAGCFWAAKKLAWYWRRECDGMRKWRHKALSLEQIRRKYGTCEMRVENSPEKMIACELV